MKSLALRFRSWIGFLSLSFGCNAIAHISAVVVPVFPYAAHVRTGQSGNYTIPHRLNVPWVFIRPDQFSFVQSFACLVVVYFSLTGKCYI